MLAQMLPEEVLELILQNLLRDRSSISACTLVCRSWSFPSSRHLFGEIKLTPTVDDSSQESNWYEDFLAKLQETARVREHVRQLVFTTTRSDGLPACHLTVLQHIFACLPHLWSFEMSYLNISTSNPSAFARSLSTQVPPLTVHKMKLDNILAFSTCDGVVVESGMAQSTGLAAFLNLFDEIEELYLNNSGLPWMSPIWHLLEANPSPLPRQNLLRLRAVHLAGYQATKMSPALQGMIELSHVKQLSVEMSPYVLASINDFVGSIPNLEILHLAARRDLVKSGLAEAPEPVHLPGLVNCSRLQELRIYTIRFYNNEAENVTYWRTVMSLLSFTPPSVSKVTVEFFSAMSDRTATRALIERSLDWTVLAPLSKAHSLEEVALLAEELTVGSWTKRGEEAVRASVDADVRAALRFGTYCENTA